MERQRSTQAVNNDFYDELGSNWYASFDHPIALLRAENKVRNPWVEQEIFKRCGRNVSVLDIGCGAGFLTNALALQGHQVVGIDLSEKSLEIARLSDQTKSVEYIAANAASLPFKENFFDVVCAMDVLEHVPSPEKLIEQASSVLKPGGLFFFHTFNRNVFSYLFIIKCMEWFVPNTPERLHVYSSFIKPKELKAFCEKEGLRVDCLRGFVPKWSMDLLTLPFRKKIPESLSFCFSKSCLTGYSGIAIKQGESNGHC
ncbi:MAG: hypothetical protein RLZZ453_843 [Chlamydiota bacterium]|jgi:2-polyprenyl-6-hydroxyphenyl methylase/3-demethylubiquinone-9 3-methyltransferase